MNQTLTVENAKVLLDKYFQREQQFNIFRVLKLENYEIRHSNMFAWLLTPSQSHGINAAFFKKFLNTVSSKSNVEIKYDESDIIKVYREQDNIDILVVNETKEYLLLIENKINSNQHDDQLERYAQIVKQKFQDYKRFYIYLKPEENEKIPEEYLYISYSDIIEILKEIIKLVQNPEVKILLNHYIEIFDNRYNKIDNVPLIDICLRLQEANAKLSYTEQEIIWKMAEQRRYEIMRALAGVLEENEIISDAEQKIYKVLFKLKKQNEDFYEFDNTNTKDNSQIKFIKYINNSPQKPNIFLDNEEYDEIFYTYGENAFNEIKHKISCKLEEKMPEYFNYSTAG